MPEISHDAETLLRADAGVRVQRLAACKNRKQWTSKNRDKQMTFIVRVRRS